MPTKSVLKTVMSLSACVLIASCGASDKGAKIDTKTKFSSKAYGVKASPRKVKYANAEVPKGGGRYQVGKPYKVRGKWYKPAEDENYSKIGLASWYGPNFHGRLTANGEIFDMNALTAAHPTLPLPSYVRVTNQENNRSIVVRVNDRGPFSNSRIIDLSSRTADLLDIKKHGVAKVKVDYVGRARIDGLDEKQLLASYSDGSSKSILPAILQPSARPEIVVASVEPSLSSQPSGSSFDAIPFPQPSPIRVGITLPQDLQGVPFPYPAPHRSGRSLAALDLGARAPASYADVNNNRVDEAHRIFNRLSYSNSLHNNEGNGKGWVIKAAQLFKRSGSTQ